MRKINKIIIHHSASPSATTTAKKIKSWHLARGFNDIGYHYMIDANGEIFKGRDEAKIGAHCKGHNRDSLGLVVFGNFDQESLNDKQESTLFLLITSIMERYDLVCKDIYPHYQLGNTACPGHELLQWVDINFGEIN